MLQRTIDYLTSKLPDIRRMVAEGVGRQEICDRLGCSHPTFRRFVIQEHIVLDRPTKLTRSTTSPGNWNQFKPNEAPTPFTHQQLKYRSMAEHSPEELAAIKAKLIAWMPATPKRMHRARADEIIYGW